MKISLLLKPIKKIENNSEVGRKKADHAYRDLNLALFWVLKSVFNYIESQAAKEASLLVAQLIPYNSEMISFSPSYIRKLANNMAQPPVWPGADHFIFDGILRNVSNSEWEEALSNKSTHRALLFILELNDEEIIELTSEYPDEYGFTVCAEI
jgi:hypothetical protein